MRHVCDCIIYMHETFIIQNKKDLRIIIGRMFKFDIECPAKKLQIIIIPQNKINFL